MQGLALGHSPVVLGRSQLLADLKSLPWLSPHLVVHGHLAGGLNDLVSVLEVVLVRRFGHQRSFVAEQVSTLLIFLLLREGEMGFVIRAFIHPSLFPSVFAFLL